MGADLINDNDRYQGDSRGGVASALAESFYRRKGGNRALSTPGSSRKKEKKSRAAKARDKLARWERTVEMGGTDLRQCRSVVKIPVAKGESVGRSIERGRPRGKKYRNAEVKVTAAETDRKGQPRAKAGTKIGA